MPIGWYITPYKMFPQALGYPDRTRYCAMNDYTDLIINTDKGNWSETEVLGDRAVVKVKASASTLAVLDGVFTRLPKNGLEDSLVTVATGDKTALKSEGLDMGYTDIEWDTDFPNDLGTYQLKDVLHFYTKRRLKPRWDGSKIVIDGIEQSCKPVELVDIEVQ